MNDFVSTLSKQTRETIQVDPSSMVFRFGGDNRKPSLGTYKIPCNIAGHNLLMTVDLIEADVTNALIIFRVCFKDKLFLVLLILHT